MTTTANQQDYGTYNQPQSPLDISHSHSVNTIPSLRDYIISEDLLAGQRADGRMSSVRRFFCLFVTFDFLFTSLMWIICVMLNGEYIIKALTEQVVHYNIQTSLFDIVLVAFSRFVVLIFFYALLYINHWIVISLSTASTCGFLIAKVFYYDWPHSSQPVFEVLLVLTSFILSWGEAWFLDFRVIPQEAHANRYLISAESERAPLIRSYVQALPSEYTESVGNFHSPYQTPNGSVHRLEQSPSAGVSYAPADKEQVEKYKLDAARAFQESWDIFQKKDWKLINKNDSDFVYLRVDAKGKKVYKLHAKIDASSKFLLEELYYRIQDLPKWNSFIKESRKVQTINENTDVTYQVSKESIGGLVPSRDFINLRHWDYIENYYVISNVKTEHPAVPVNKKMTRCENGVGCSIIESTDNPCQCNLVWIVNTDLRLWLPGSLLDKEMSLMMLRYAKDLRQHISGKKQTA